MFRNEPSPVLQRRIWPGVTAAEMPGAGSLPAPRVSGLVEQPHVAGAAQGCEGTEHAGRARSLDGFAAGAARQRAALSSRALPGCGWLFLALFIISPPLPSPQHLKLK